MHFAGNEIQPLLQAHALPAAMMNLMHWRLLVAVADHGSITAAAERVGMTQSAAASALLAMLAD
ncbi:regulatory helix-turn-helix protein, lysR family [Pseudomonas libanensis]|nr:regulatory helix-turn-helix protein, lysR family [Pseudomonas libanensis]